MTKEQAFKNLSLPEDADIETIRMRFAARYTQSDVQHDRTLTDGMKTVHEQHLRELEQAYKVATDNPIIADMGALLSLGKGYVEENGDSIGSDDTLTTDEALAFFALYPQDSPALAEQRYTQYVTELEEAIEQVGLEASKEPYRQEIARAETSLHVAINYLLASQMLAEQQEEAVAIEEVDPVGKLEVEDIDEPVYAANTVSKPVNKRIYGILSIVAIALLAIGIWIGRGSGTDGDDNGKPDDNVTTHVEVETTQSSATNVARSSAQPEITETPTAVSQQTEEEPAMPQPSPQEKIKAILQKHLPGYDINVGKANIQLEKLDGGQKYVFPYQNIFSINAKGEFTGIDLFVNSEPKEISEGMRLVSASQKEKDELIQEIRKIKDARKPVANNTATNPAAQAVKKEVVSIKTETESSKPAIVKRVVPKSNTVKKENPPVTEQEQKPASPGTEADKSKQPPVETE
ncbi:hypothetical protein [Sphingobacterium sp. FBM7-1]|uniref:hypothetical protein n=1 Tax=Sphingobacterium sp. FBM7-1 TaxID=2886688 RepID=UPI001D10EBC2|nr:hypothetical protein [Sphingobacterium sp. FBM7-1]MCC2599661.1 hypothetical protein [Sphingobacterium sp. FBM7-1]